MGFTAMAAVAAAGTAYSVYSGERAASAQEDAQKQATAQAKANAASADEATNKANQKKPNTAAILSDAMQAGKGGQSGTMLTGSAGVDPNALALGKTTLLGA